MNRVPGWAPMAAAEYLKLKRTLVLALAVVAPFVPVFFSFFMGLLTTRKVPPGANPWDLATSSTLQMWSLLMLPFLVAIQTALMAQLESGNNQWKHLHALPLSRTRLYLVKAGVVASLLLLSTALLLVYSLAGGALLGLFKPGLGLLRTAPDLALLAGSVFRPLLAVMFLLAIHQWISHRWPSLVVALGVGMAGLTGVLAVTSSARWGRIFPWSLPYRAMRPGAPDLDFILLYAVAGCLVVLALGVWDARGREMA